MRDGLVVAALGLAACREVDGVLAAAVMLGLAAVLYLVVVGRIEPLTWRTRGEDAA